MGNQFLASKFLQPNMLIRSNSNHPVIDIRSASVVLNLLRCYEDTEITHVENSVDPLRDADIISAELIISDMELLDRLSKKKTTSGAMKTAIAKSLACTE